MQKKIPPIERSIWVPWNQEIAFDRFTNDFGEWWPRTKFSIGGERIKKIVFETRLGGLIYEEHMDGRRFRWGEVTLWMPPERVIFKWHPSKSPSSAQTVEITFTTEGQGTKVKLVSSGWENWGKGAKGARNGHDAGWNYLLNTWAGRRTLQMSGLDLLIKLMTFVQHFKRGRDAVIRRAEGEIPGTDKQEK